MEAVVKIMYIKNKATDKGFVVETGFPLWEDLVREYLLDHDVIGPRADYYPPGVYPYVPYGQYTIELYWNAFAGKCILKHACINVKQAHIIMLKLLNVKMEDDNTL